MRAATSLPAGVEFSLVMYAQASGSAHCPVGQLRHHRVEAARPDVIAQQVLRRGRRFSHHPLPLVRGSSFLVALDVTRALRGVGSCPADVWAALMSPAP